MIIQETIRSGYSLREPAVVSHDIERGQENLKIDDAEALRKGKVNDNVLIALVKQLLAYRGSQVLVRRYAHCVQTDNLI